MTAELHQGPLQGLRVIDIATVFAGPSAARRLADFGAEVIKVERVGEGDGARKLGERDGADGYYWRHMSRNKRPIELDLKQEAGKDVLLRLVRTADVIVENFRPGTLERLGLDPATVLLRENPRLVVLRVTGFGQDGPYASRAGFGTIAEAMSTLAYTTGQADGPPTLPPQCSRRKYVSMMMRLDTLSNSLTSSGVPTSTTMTLLGILRRMSPSAETQWLPPVFRCKRSAAASRSLLRAIQLWLLSVL